MKKTYKNKIPRDVREAAVRAIKKGTGLEAVAEHNRIADEINEVSFYYGKHYPLALWQNVPWVDISS